MHCLCVSFTSHTSNHCVNLGLRISNLVQRLWCVDVLLHESEPLRLHLSQMVLEPHETSVEESVLFGLAFSALMLLQIAGHLAPQLGSLSRAWMIHFVRFNFCHIFFFFSFWLVFFVCFFMKFSNTQFRCREYSSFEMAELKRYLVSWARCVHSVITKPQKRKRRDLGRVDNRRCW